MSLEFLLTALIVVVAPGTGVVYTLAVGLGVGRRATVWAALGCTLGILPAIGAALLGLSAALHAGAIVFLVIKYLGAAYLLYLAYMTLTDRGALSISARSSEKSPLEIARIGFLINVLNPKLAVFFMAFLPPFIDPTAGSALAQMLLLSAVFMAMTFAVFVMYGAFAAQFSDWIRARPSVLDWMRRAVAGAFAAFGARLLLAER